MSLRIQRPRSESTTDIQHRDDNYQRHQANRYGHIVTMHIIEQRRGAWLNVTLWLGYPDRTAIDFDQEGDSQRKQDQHVVHKMQIRASEQRTVQAEQCPDQPSGVQDTILAAPI